MNNRQLVEKYVMDGMCNADRMDGEKDTSREEENAVAKPTHRQNTRNSHVGQYQNR